MIFYWMLILCVVTKLRSDGFFDQNINTWVDSHRLSKQHNLYSLPGLFKWRQCRPDCIHTRKRQFFLRGWRCALVFFKASGRVRLGSIRNKNNWNNASKRLFGSYSHSGIPGFPFRLFYSQEQNNRNIFRNIFRNKFLFRNIPNERALSQTLCMILKRRGF